MAWPTPASPGSSGRSPAPSRPGPTGSGGTAGTPERGRAPEVGFARLSALFATRQRSENTRLAYQADLDRFARWCQGQGTEPLALGPADLDRYRATCLADGISPATVARRLAALGSFYALAVEQGSIADSPLAQIQRRPIPAGPSVTGELDPSQAAALVAAGVRLNPKTALLVDLLLLDGLKLGEALAADAADVASTGAGSGPTAFTLTVSRRRGPADITLHPPTGKAIANYLGDRRSGPLLLSDSPIGGRSGGGRSGGGRSGGRSAGDGPEATGPGRLTRFGADYLLKRASEEAGLASPVSANVLRRSYVAMAHAGGDSVETIREYLGHQDARTTRRHLASSEGDGPSSSGAPR